MQRMVLSVYSVFFSVMLIVLVSVLTACGNKGYLKDHPKGCTSEAAYKAGYYDGKHDISYRSDYGDDCKHEYGDTQGSYRTGYNDGQEKRSQGGLVHHGSDDSGVTGVSDKRSRGGGLFHHKSRSSVTNPKSSASTAKSKSSVKDIDKDKAKHHHN